MRAIISCGNGAAPSWRIRSVRVVLVPSSRPKSSIRRIRRKITMILLLGTRQQLSDLNDKGESWSTRTGDTQRTRRRHRGLERSSFISASQQKRRSEMGGSSPWVECVFTSAPRRA